MVREEETQRRNQLHTRSGRDPAKRESGGTGHREIERNHHSRGKKSEVESRGRGREIHICVQGV